MGYMTHIDDHGDTQGNFTLLARKRSPRDGEKKAPYGMYPVGTFLLNQNDTKLPVRHLDKNQKAET